MSYTVYRRNNIILDIAVKDENDAAIDLTGCDIYFFVGDQIEKSTADGITVTSSVDGTIEVVLTADDTDITPRNYTCEVLVVDSDGNRWTGDLGVFRVKSNLSFASEGV